ncbi:hypothetical protein ACS0TY_023347 [Phlomoides rotata]
MMTLDFLEWLLVIAGCNRPCIGVEAEFFPAIYANEVDQEDEEEVPYDMDAELEALWNATPSDSGSDK